MNRNIGRILHPLILLLALASPLAQAATGPDQAQALVKETADKILSRITEERQILKENPDRIYPLVEDIVLPHFDFTKMSQWVLGKYWRTASESQRKEFTLHFRDLLVRTYAKALLEYDNQAIEYLPVHAPEDAKTVTVPTLVNQNGGPSIPISYRLYRKGDKWLVFDISVDGVSLISNYRTSFSSQISQGGLDKLIAHLAERSAGKEMP